MYLFIYLMIASTYQRTAKYICQIVFALTVVSVKELKHVKMLL